MEAAIGIIFLYSCILCAVGWFTRKQRNKSEIKSFVLMDDNVPAALIAPSIFNSWVWITTIIGAAETTILYGISGGVAYAFGAAIAFCILIVVIIKLQNLMPDAIFITEFIRKRFSQKAGSIFQLLSVLITLYILIEMAAGIGFVYYGLFGVSFKKIAFFTVIISVIFVVLTGMPGVIYNDFINFLMIVLSFGILVSVIMYRFDTTLLYHNMEKIRVDTENLYHNESIFDFFVIGGIRYFFAAILIALAQLSADPGYYLKARIAKDQRSIIKAFILGGVILFVPVAMLSSIVFGCTALALDLDIHYGLNSSIVISGAMLLEYFGSAMRILAGLMLLSIAMTTIISSLMGMMGIAILDIYPNKINECGDEKDCLRFGKIFTAMMGLVGALISISLESISILSIDVFCGIVFAAFFGAILMGFLSRKKLGNLITYAAIFGALAGFLCWMFIPNETVDWFYGTMISFIIPIVFLGVCSVFVKDEFHFASLRSK